LICSFALALFPYVLTFVPRSLHYIVLYLGRFDLFIPDILIPFLQICFGPLSLYFRFPTFYSCVMRLDSELLLCTSLVPICNHVSFHIPIFLFPYFIILTWFVPSHYNCCPNCNVFISLQSNVLFTVDARFAIEMLRFVPRVPNYIPCSVTQQCDFFMFFLVVLFFSLAYFHVFKNCKSGFLCFNSILFHFSLFSKKRVYTFLSSHDIHFCSLIY
jgi:hypothetical protein